MKYCMFKLCLKFIFFVFETQQLETMETVGLDVCPYEKIENEKCTIESCVNNVDQQKLQSSS